MAQTKPYSQPLPLPREEYEMSEETMFRRTVELVIGDLNTRTIEVEEVRTTPSSLAQRRYQFLLMGASSG